jgi:signal transduction histidine kinase
VQIGLAADTLTIAVRDRGPGIHRADRDRLFERFYRGRAARPHVPGTGMGLSIARGLIEAQGGRIAAENHPDGGALFSLSVPAPVRTVAALEEEHA